MISSQPNGAISVLLTEPEVGGGEGVRALTIAGRRYDGSFVGEIGLVAILEFGFELTQVGYSL
jgi:hypothetical protein